MDFTYCPKCGKKDTVQKISDTDYECSNCAWHFWNNTKLCVTPIFVKDDQVLVSRRGREPHKGKLDIMGGFAEYGEGPYEAAKREAMEETSLTIHELCLVDVWHREYVPGIYVVDVVLLVTKWEGTPKAGDDVASLEWQPLEAIEGDDFAFSYPGLVKKLRSLL
jgi:ADP-ribose pyrophosphatase YjhB (NUDIX family)